MEKIMKNLFLLSLISISFGGSLFCMEKPDPAPAIKIEDKEQILIDALKNGDLDKVKKIFDQPGSDVNKLVLEFYTPLMVAAFNGHEKYRPLLNQRKEGRFYHCKQRRHAPNGTYACCAARPS